tara:strand:+ start:55 stop:696 length:642 start_codon:yes stop_codon:yes gene_type:complete
MKKLQKTIINCQKCPRLVPYLAEIKEKKVKRFIHQEYWGKPVPSFGDIKAEIMLLGLAPGAHGANRTGRMFTGDKSGEWLYKALFEAGFASQPNSVSSDDGMVLNNIWITAAIHCAPPQNKPIKEELDNCFNYLLNEISLLSNLKVVVCLGKIAFDTCAKLLKIKGEKFAHGHQFKFQNYHIICSYHPSQQNTQTGRLTWEMWSQIFEMCKKL